MNGLDLRFDCADELFAARERLVASVELVADLRDFRQSRFDRHELLLANRDLHAPLLELFEHSLSPRELILAGLDLADGVALPTLHQVQLAQQHILYVD